jgi:uroporphyrinogen decarboxylase
MNSKERVRCALRHESPDRVPTDLGAVSEVWRKLEETLGCESQDEVLDALNIDIRVVDPPYIGPPLKSYEQNGDRIEEHWLGFKCRWHWNGFQWDNFLCDGALEQASSVEEVMNYAWPDPDWFDYESVKTQCKRYEGRAIMIGHAGVYQIPSFMRGSQQIYIDMAAQPEIAKAVFDRCVAFELEYYDRILTAAGGQVDILRTFDDYGTQVSTLFSPAMWRHYFAENTRKMTALAHRHGAFMMQHSCGAIRPILPEFVACGVDAVDPIQKVPGLEPERLKEDFGDVLTFHGGIDTQDLLPYGTPEQVEAEARRFVDILNRDGGYILCSSQDYQGDVPMENILAVYKAAA